MSDLLTVPLPADHSQELPPGKTSFRKQGNRSFAEMNSLELFSISSGDHSLEDKPRSSDVSCATDLSNVEPPEAASLMEDSAAENIRSSDSEADVDMEDDEQQLSSSPCLSNIPEEDEGENDSPRNERLPSTSYLISRHRESGCKDDTSVLTNNSYNQLQSMSESPQMLFIPKLQTDPVSERMSCLPQHHQDGMSYVRHSLSDRAGICQESGFLTPCVKMPACLQRALQKSAHSIKVCDMLL